jgi:DNA-binding transcriptional regulator YiaG
MSELGRGKDKQMKLYRGTSEAVARAALTESAIAAIRTRLGLTQASFAKKLGVSYVTVNRWENGHVKPSRLAIEKLEKLARKMGVL